MFWCANETQSVSSTSPELEAFRCARKTTGLANAVNRGILSLLKDSKTKAVQIRTGAPTRVRNRTAHRLRLLAPADFRRAGAVSPLRAERSDHRKGVPDLAFLAGIPARHLGVGRTGRSQHRRRVAGLRYRTVTDLLALKHVRTRRGRLASSGLYLERADHAGRSPVSAIQRDRDLHHEHRSVRRKFHHDPRGDVLVPDRTGDVLRALVDAAKLRPHRAGRLRVDRTTRCVMRCGITSIS